MEFKGTPAPWYVANRTDLSEPHGIIKSGEKFIAYTITKGVGREKEDANALLIAAAPELLEVLMAINGNHYLSDKNQNRLTKVIAKALGQQ